MLREPKRHFTEWEKISDHMSNKGLIFEICKAFSIQKIQQEPIPETPVKILKMTRRNMKICSSWLMIMISTHKKIQRFVKKKIKIGTLCDPVILLLGIYFKNSKALLWKISQWGSEIILGLWHILYSNHDWNPYHQTSLNTIRVTPYEPVSTDARGPTSPQYMYVYIYTIHIHICTHIHTSIYILYAHTLYRYKHIQIYYS